MESGGYKRVGETENNIYSFHQKQKKKYLVNIS